MDNEKYSLRQRQRRKQVLGRIVDSQGYASDNSNESLTSNNQSKIPSSNNGKSKTKAAPLSKYRRKTANARERTRMREINSAFENLRHCVPACITNEDVGSTNEKLTKITTLRLAMKYIRVLSEALVNPQNVDYEFLYDCALYKPHKKIYVDSQDEMDSQVPSPKRGKLKKANMQKISISRKATSSKKQAKKDKLGQNEKLPLSPIPNICHVSPASTASSAYASLSSSESSASPTSNSSNRFEGHCFSSSVSNSQYLHHSISDLSNFMLESDGESLGLPERGLSPLHTKHKITSMTSEPFDCSPSDMPTLENPLELSLRLMETANDSLTLSSDQVTASSSSCFSPLINLEPFNTFDLFHPDFNEEAAIGLFLT
ncbi:helix-loop-helix protein delilah taxi [Haematobia irritans]|uniref:helix-loop-helix protein delilah taxi n=1 Tax=Haematobia irritans TaxID=7368 RepID=UPI003F4FB572